MKVYGKFNRYVPIIGLNNSSKISEAEISFSSDEDNYDEIATSDISKKCDTSDSNIGIDIKKRISSSNNELDLLNFLNEPALKRRRNYIKQEFSVPTIEKPFYEVEQVINNVDNILTSLNSKSNIDLHIADDNKREINMNKKNSSSRVTYGKTRTFLVKKVTSDSEVEDSTNCINTEDLCDDTSLHHFNQLKNMGESLKYQDELDFIMDLHTPSTRNDKISKILNLTLNFLNDKHFLDYIIRYYSKEIWEWCFLEIDSNDEILSLLQVFIVTTIPIQPSDILWDKIMSERFIIPLMKYDSINPSITGSKIMKRNYEDFLEKTSCKSILNYVLEICEKRIDILISKQNILHHFIPLLRKIKCSKLLLKVIYIIQKIISTDVPDIYKQEYINLLVEISQLYEGYQKNENYIKCLIKLTNYSDVLKEVPTNIILVLAVQVLYFILDYKDVLYSDGQSILINIMILHLGLSLNLFGETNIIVPIEVTNNLKQIFQEFSKNKNLSKNFMVSMFLLIFAYINSTAQLKMDQNERQFLKNELLKFSIDMKTCNKSIFDKVEVALNLIS